MSVTAINFGTTPATSFTVNSPTQITAVAPAGTGTVNVRVVTTHGTSATAAANQFTYTAPATPTITNLNPNNGPAAGGTSVVITGTNLTGATQVRFGATNATSYTVNSATQITAVSPAGSGAQNVTVTTPDGTSGALTFTYAAALTIPAITSANTANAMEGAAFSYTITASGNPAPTFAISGQPAWLSLSGAVVSGTPPAASGGSSATFTVTATNSQGSSPGVLVTVNILAGWELTRAFSIRPTFNTTNSRTALNSFNGYAAAAAAVDAVMTDDLYNSPPASMAQMPVALYAQYPGQSELLITFDQFGGTSGPDKITHWGYHSGTHSIYVSGNNGTGGDIQFRLVST